MKKKQLVHWTIITSLTLASLLPAVAVDAAKGSDKIKELEEINEKKSSLLDEIAAKDKSLKEFTDQIKKSEEQIELIQQDVKKEEVKLKEAEDKQAFYQGIYNTKMITFYQNNEIGYLSNLLQAKDLGDFFRRVELIRLAGLKDSEILREHKKATKVVQDNLKRLDDLQNKQQEEATKTQEAFQKIIDAKKKDESELGKLDEIVEDYEDEIIDINRDLISSGRLSFTYKGPIAKPIDAAMNSTFGIRWGRMHEGNDFAAPVGTQYRAAADGVVVESRVASGYGWLITIYHGKLNGKDVYTRYGHSYKNQVMVRVGEEVKKNQVISKVGNNGRSTGPHLHFEVRYGTGSKPPAQNPALWINKK
ncbi:murein hydrolase activator EnvC family protein [Risungbinella massiliensis]|uniref:murein hydrolase activator EnvC family protein n=1 Tax=Risungbinella massiliensis TaxID=1329796 RepID=UPI0005CC6598|nr:M23 family metallopeptidase [Risungbinella massiliensis]